MILFTKQPLRSSHGMCSVRKGIFHKLKKKFRKNHRKKPDLQLYLKKRLWHRCFSVNFVKFLSTPFYRTSPGDCSWPFADVFKIDVPEAVVDVLRNFAKFTGKHLCQSLFFNKVPSFLLKKILWHRCFPANFVKFLRTHFFIEPLWWLLLMFLNLTTSTQVFPVNIAKFLRTAFLKTPPLAASALNFALYFQVANSGCTIQICELFLHE